MSYTIVNISSGILAVHAALLPSGKVLYFSGSQHVYPVVNLDATRLCNPATSPPSIEHVSSPNVDLFCSGHAFLPDGRLLVAGGTQQYDADPDPHINQAHFRGLRNAFIFDHTVSPEIWVQAAPMLFEPGRNQGGGRWYPSLLTLADGRVLAMSGHPEDSDSRHNNWSMEAFTLGTGTGTWADKGRQPDAGTPDSYPRLHTLPNGDVFCATPMPNQAGPWKTQKWSPATHTWSDITDVPAAGYDVSIGWSSVLLPLIPPDYQARVLLVGNETARVIDIGGFRTTIVGPNCDSIRDNIAEIESTRRDLRTERRDAAPGRKAGIGGSNRMLDEKLAKLKRDLQICLAGPGTGSSTTWVWSGAPWVNTAARTLPASDPCSAMRNIVATLEAQLKALQPRPTRPRPIGKNIGDVAIIDNDIDEAKAKQIRLLKAEITRRRQDLSNCIAGQQFYPANATRVHCNAVILPDGKILVLGGLAGSTASSAVLAAELYDPTSNTWSTLGASTIPRGYHSVALLLPDGRVWVAGSDLGNRNLANKELRIELFSPPYISASARPNLISTPVSVNYGSSFTIECQANLPIGSVALVRCSSVTHSYNSDQRYIRLNVTQIAGTLITVVAPPNGAIAPAGNYLLFVLDSNRIPSVGRFVKVH